MTTISDSQNPTDINSNDLQQQRFVKIVSRLMMAILLLMLVLIISKFTGQQDLSVGTLFSTIINSPIFWAALAVGMAAQAVDGALGMAYGVTSNTFLLANGVPPAVASGAVHLAEVFTTGASGMSHLRLGNVHRMLFLRLVIPGAIGGAIGAYVLTQVDGNLIKPFIQVYLILMGFYILSKAFRKKAEKDYLDLNKKQKSIPTLAVFGGGMDAMGGGGWGPIVTTNLLSANAHPRLAIGSVNTAEFFITLVISAVFVATLSDFAQIWLVTLGLVLGGLIVAPFAAKLTHLIEPKKLMVLVAILIITISGYGLSKFIF
ncbi:MULTISPECIES: sulfite exporter TauE/SafE family protein [unclassified Acinetobacter]|uniref:sulfite exporter TauE/SafE family protein n=1 Tax=unclassified Acinetobacter TaxID=196816 RepID=UPI0035BB370B